MTYQESEFKGDKLYNVDCTGDAVVGDQVRFERATFGGSYRKPTFTGFELVTGEIIRDSYGSAKQQHTFTLRLEDGSESRIKGRNLYKNGVFRKAWSDECLRQESQEEKHSRGDLARTARDVRRENNLCY